MYTSKIIIIILTIDLKYAYNIIEAKKPGKLKQKTRGIKCKKQKLLPTGT